MNSIYKNFDNDTLEYDHDCYPWGTWVLEIIQEVYPYVTSLENIHKEVPTKELIPITDMVQKRLSAPDYSKEFDTFAKTYIAPLLNDKRYLIKRRPTLNLVIPNQERLGRKLPFHQGIFYKNGRGQGTIWMPLTRAYDTNSMYVVPTDSSRKITKALIEGQWSQKTFEDTCLETAYPVDLEVGQAHLFHQEILHGNVNNETDITRMAIDWHVLVEGEEFGGRLPGGFFRLPNDTEYKTINHTNDTCVGYIGNNTNYDRDIPLNLQRDAVRLFCKEHSIPNNMMQVENEYLHWMPILEDLLESEIDVIVMHSIYSLPDARRRREYLINLALKNNITMWFANEEFCLSNESEKQKINTYLNFGHKQKGWLPWET